VLRNAEKRGEKVQQRKKCNKRGREIFVSYSAKMPINMYEIEKWEK
jgi:hypothetical protein